MMVSGLSNNKDNGGRTGLAEYNSKGEFVASHWLPTDGDLRGAKKEGQRGYFNLKNYKTLLKKSNKMIGTRFKIAQYKHIEITEELHDFIVFMVGSMLRPTLSEVYSLQFKDINVKN